MDILLKSPKDLKLVDIDSWLKKSLEEVKSGDLAHQ